MLKCEMTESELSICDRICQEACYYQLPNVNRLLDENSFAEINRKAFIPAWFKSVFEICIMSAKCVHNSLTEMSYHLLLPFIKQPFVVV